MSQPRADSRGNLRLALILGSLSAFGPITTDLYLPALPAAAADLDASQPAIQATLTACLIGLAVGQIFVGPLSDSIGRRRPMVVGMALFILSSLLCAVAPSVYLLDVARLLQGAAGAAGTGAVLFHPVAPRRRRDPAYFTPVPSATAACARRPASAPTRCASKPASCSSCPRDSPVLRAILTCDFSCDSTPSSAAPWLKTCAS